MKLGWRRILIGFGIVVGVAWFHPFFPGVPSLLTKRDFNNPAMWKVPVAIPDLAISTALGMKLSYFGWQFEVPWKDLDPSKTKLVGKPPWQWQMICFRSGRRIIFIRRPANYWSKILFPPGDSYFEEAYIRWLFGKDASSDYTFTR